MPTMDKQQVLEAVEEAITEGGNIVIRFGWGQMRTLKQEEAELLLAALKPSPSYVPREALEALRPFAALGGPDDGFAPAFHDLADDVVVYGNSGQYITAGDVRRARKLTSSYVQRATISGGER